MKGRELSSGSNLKIYYKDEPELLVPRSAQTDKRQTNKADLVSFL
jgi:hypothetical protein